MPPPPAPGQPAVYEAAFYPGNGAPLYFDIQRDGYRSSVQALANVRPIPWAFPGTYKFVVQFAGIQQFPRTYTAVVYFENDFLLLASAVGRTGAIWTPREPNFDQALLQGVQRQSADWTTVNGWTIFQIDFLVLP